MSGIILSVLQVWTHFNLMATSWGRCDYYSLFSWENWDKKKLGNFTIVPQIISGGARIQTQAVQIPDFRHCNLSGQCQYFVSVQTKLYWTSKTKLSGLPGSPVFLVGKKNQSLISITSFGQKFSFHFLMK